jgi:hypothetical protein
LLLLLVANEWNVFNEIVSVCGLWLVGSISSLELRHVVGGLLDRICELMENAFVFDDLLFAKVAFGNKVIVIGLVLEIGEIDFVDDAGVIFLEQIHILEQIISVIF